jgi:hypothetical protein
MYYTCTLWLPTFPFPRFTGSKVKSEKLRLKSFPLEAEKGDFSLVFRFKDKQQKFEATQTRNESKK